MLRPPTSINDSEAAEGRVLVFRDDRGTAGDLKRKFGAAFRSRGAHWPRQRHLEYCGLLNIPFAVQGIWSIVS
jgi:hypothetical protein